MEKYKRTQQRVTVIGLGQMGIRLAELLRDNGDVVTVWNRTISKAKGIKNVQVIEHFENAVSQSQIIVICVYDYHAVNEILTNLEDISILRDKTVINLTSGSPEEAHSLEQQIKGYGGQYIDGAIQVAPDQMGLPDTTILLSGEEGVYKKYENLFKIFGGNIKYLGEGASAASAMDLATLTWLYGSYVGLIYGAGLVNRAGLKLSLYSDLLAEITPGFTAFFKHELKVIETDDFTISQSPLSISVSATQRILDAVKSSGMDSGFPENIAALLRKAEIAGYGGQELASLIKVVQK